MYKSFGSMGLMVWFVVLATAVWGAPPKHVILLIGDGMGFEQVKAAGMYRYGSAGTLSFEALPYSGEVVTTPAGGGITDSAASGTAMATGFKVYNGVVSQLTPGDGRELTTALEYFKNLGYRTGLVTTTYMTHATPACFAAHESSRNNTSAIAGDYLQQTQPDLLFGGGANGLTVATASAAGYTVATTCSELDAIDPDTAMRVSAQFGTSHLPYEYEGYGNECHLFEMTAWALDMLEEDPQGFFLMVEGGRIDHAGHSNLLPHNVLETVAFDDAVQVVLDWAAGRSDTLVVVTADHETGGLLVLENQGQGEFPTVSWSTTGHTGVNVPIYAWGENAEFVGGVLDNTEVFDVLTVSPEIALTALTFSHVLDFGGTLPNDTFMVSNTGVGTLEYAVSDDATWLTVSPDTGTSTGESDTVVITYDVGALNAGVNEAVITVSDGLARNNPQAITVTVELNALPGDLDLDGDVDQSDFGRFQACLTGAAVAQEEPSCLQARLDDDADVDANDLSIFLGCRSGANVGSDPNCAG